MAAGWSPLQPVERRRLQIVGGTTYAVTLPKWWAQRLGLRPGQELELRLLPDGSILVAPSDKQHGAGEAIINVSNGMRCSTVIREIVVRYVLGYNSIRLSSGSTLPLELKNCVSEFISTRMIGVEIIEEYSNTMLLHCFTPPDMVSVTKVLQRMSRAALYMLSDAIHGVLEGDEKLLEDVVRRDDVVDKFYLYLLRQLNGVLANRVTPSKVGLTTHLEAPFLMMAAKQIERVGDHAEHVSRAWLASRPGALGRARKELEPLASAIIRLFEKSVTILTSPDRSVEPHQVIDEALELRQNVREAASKLLRRTTVMDEFIIVKTLTDSLARIAEYIADIAEAGLNIGVARSLSNT